MIEKDAILDTPPLEEYLAGAIAIKIREKEANKVAPPYVELQELLAQVKEDATEALRRMTKSKLLTCHTTLNSVSFEFTPPK